MSILANDFRNKVGKMKDIRMKNEGLLDVGYSTGFTSLDFRNGTSFMGKKDGKPIKNYILGLIDGSMNMIVGRSSSGKTTLAMQMAGNIVREFEDGVIYHDDIEGGTNYPRRKLLLNFSDEEMENKYIYRNSGITVENLYQRIKLIYDTKMEHADELTYGTGIYDTNGDEVLKLIPTVYIVDSVAALMPEKYADEDEISGQMAATATAKANKAMANRLLQLLKPANIIMIFINHINDDVTTGLFPKKAMLPFLKQGETLPGGKGIHYFQNNIIRIDDGSKLKSEDKFRIDGNIAMVSFLKSRTNKSGQGVPLIFDQNLGYDNELSILQLLSQNKMINGAGAHLYIGDNKDKKFSNKNFKKDLHDDLELRDIVMKSAIDILISMTDKNFTLDDMDIEDTTEVESLNTGIMKLLND